MRWVERGLAIIAGVSVVAAVSVLVARSDTSRLEGSATVTLAQTPTPVPATVKPLPAPVATRAPRASAMPSGVGAITTTEDVKFRKGPSLQAPARSIMPRGVLAPVLAKRDGFFKVLSPNENVGWVHMSKVKTHLRSTPKKAHRLRDATIVIDPGHGGRLPGAKGKHGLLEKVANTGIAKRLKGQLRGARVFLTNTGQHAGLAYRAALANRLNAHAFVSVHNNALPDKLSKLPGAEVYYSQRPGSKRLAGLLYEELFKTLARYNIGKKWGRDPFAGAKYRLSQEHGGDYYAVLRRSYVPAVIVESMFITNPAEERLLRRADVRQAIAEALGRGLRRFLTSGDPGSGFQDPYERPTPDCPIPGCFEHRK
jgi:N-acetylmuramoyl-L-alanine amidase